MDNNTQPTEQQVQTQLQAKPVRKPNELGGFDISGFVKIYDPNTNETFVEDRA
jgi:hypothetical protein